MSSDPSKPTDRDVDWDDERPTEVRVDPIAESAPLPAAPAMKSADETDEHPVVLDAEIVARAILPDYLIAELEVIGGPHRREPFRISTMRTMIGRGQAADVRLNDAKMSKEYASIFYRGSEFRIRDERSTNGTFLNGSRVVEYAVRDGDKILVGDSLLRLRLTAR